MAKTTTFLRIVLAWRACCRSAAVALALPLTLTLAAGIACASDDLERQLLKESPAILQYLRDREYRNVGVLKFRTKKGGESGSDRAGTMNLQLASRLELALILANKPQNPLGIIHDASAVAARIPGANHINPAGRKQLFTERYRLAWGDELVEPDAFLTGAVNLSQDLKTLTVSILCFDRSGDELQRVSHFSTMPDAGHLAESGESFVLRGVFDNGKAHSSDSDKSLLAAAERAIQVRDSADATKHPLATANTESPVELELHYDQQVIPIDIHDGKAFVVEPQENQNVWFVIKRKVKDEHRYGVVLKINGENTLERQRYKDAECRKWILERNCPPIVLRGYQMNETTAEAFRVLSRAESQVKEIEYGPDLGTISLVVFREKQRSDAAPAAAALEDEDFAVLRRGAFPKEQPVSLPALKAQLTEQVNRGLIARGDTIVSAMKRTTFDTDPTPVMSAVVTYYPR